MKKIYLDEKRNLWVISDENGEIAAQPTLKMVLQVARGIVKWIDTEFAYSYDYLDKEAVEFEESYND